MAQHDKTRNEARTECDLEGLVAGQHILFVETGPWVDANLKPAACGLTDRNLETTTDALEELPDERLEPVTALSIFIGSEVGADQLDRMPNLQLIATRSTGYDHVDLGACRERDITVCNVSEYAEHTVAEHTFGLMLALSRKILQAYDRTRRNDFSLAGLAGFELREKTLGVIGAGAIGLRVIRIGVAMGMRVFAYDVNEQPLLSDVLGFEYRDLDELLSESDIVSLHVPLVPATRHIIDRDALQKMKQGALLINTARGELVDTDALLEALSNGHLGGAGLDVIEGEERMGDEAQLSMNEAPREELALAVNRYALLQRDDVVLTPHMGFYSYEALHKLMATTCDNICAYLSGQPQNVVS